MHGFVGVYAIFLLAIFLMLWALVSQFAAKPRIAKAEWPSSPLPVVSANAVNSMRIPHRSQPWLVVKLPRVPEIQRWRADWGVSTVRVLRSPGGTFAAYSCATVVDSGRIRFDPSCDTDKQCIPAHIESLHSPEESAEIFQSAPPPQVYLRGQGGAEVVDSMISVIDDLERISPYLSAQGAVTTLHWDGADGILWQTSGVKLVSIFAPGGMPAEAPESSPCHRRSHLAGRECPEGATMSVHLQPGFGLYIPRRWAHHVTSLSPTTLGAVWRFKPPQRG